MSVRAEHNTDECIIIITERGRVVSQHIDAGRQIYETLYTHYDTQSDKCIPGSSFTAKYARYRYRS